MDCNLASHACVQIYDNEEIEVDSRVPAATHIDLQKATREGFRNDLYFAWCWSLRPVSDDQLSTASPSLNMRRSVSAPSESKRTASPSNSPSL